MMNKLTTYALLATSVAAVFATSPVLAHENEKNNNSNKPKIAIQVKKVNQSIKKTNKIVKQSIKKIDKIIVRRTSSSTPANVLAYRAAVKQAQVNFQASFKTIKATYEAAIRNARLQFLGNTTTPSNSAPTVATPAAVSPSPINGTTATFSVLGADDGGEGNLVYFWTTTSKPSGASDPIFNVGTNGLNAGKNITATFSKAGTYTVKATITDTSNHSTSSSVTVTVNPVVSSVSISPVSTILHTSSTAQFFASAVDQFGDSQSSFNWFLVEGSVAGSISSTGLYSAPTSTTGTFHAVVNSQLDTTKRATSTIEIIP